MSFLYLTSKAYLKLKYYTLEVDGEIIGFLIIDDVNGLLVEDVILPRQEISSTTCDFNSLQFDTLLSDNNIDISKIRGWFHSHDTMGLGFSHTDDDTIEKLGRRMPYVVSIVTCKRRNNNIDLEAKIDIFRPIRIEERLDITTEIEDDNQLRQLVQNEIKERVSKRRVVIYHPRSDVVCPFPSGQCDYKGYQFCPYVNSKCPKNKYKRWNIHDLELQGW